MVNAGSHAANRAGGPSAACARAVDAPHDDRLWWHWRCEARRACVCSRGVHTSRCSDETITVTSKLLPNVDAFAVDMPGRQGIPGDLWSLTHEICAHTLADQILERVGPDHDSPVVIVGHSLAGVVIPGLVQRLGVDRVRHVVFVACCVPSPGESVIQTLPFPLNRIARRIVERKPVISAPHGVVRYFFGNRSTRAQRAEIRDNLCAESSAILTGISTERLPEAVPTSWVLPTRDRALPPRFQSKTTTASAISQLSASTTCRRWNVSSPICGMSGGASLATTQPRGRPTSRRGGRMRGTPMPRGLKRLAAT